MKRSKLITFIISLVVAVALWLYVVAVVNPEGERVISNIPVVFSDEVVLREDQELLIMESSNKTVTATFHGKNSDLNKLLQDQDELRAVVDVSRLRSDREYKMSYEIVLPNSVSEGSITVTDHSPNEITFFVEKLVRMPIEVRVDLSDVEIADGYMHDKASLDYDTVLVEGPKSVVDTIDCAQVVMNRTNVDKTISEFLPYTLLDKEGKPVDTSELTLETGEVEVTLNVVKYTDIKLSVEMIDGGGATSKDVTIDIEPKQITLSGDATVLDGINTIILGTIDLSEMLTGKETFTFPILIPNNAKNLSGVEEATVAVEIKNKSTKTIRIDGTKLQFLNVPEGLEASSVRKQIDVLIRANTKDIDRINANNVRIVIDLASYSTAGTYPIDPVNVRVEIDGFADAGVLDVPDISIALIEPAEEEPEETDENAEDANTTP